MGRSSFLWYEPELLRIEALILKETRGAEAAEQALRRALECAQAFEYPVLERRCLISLKKLLEPGRHDVEVEMRLKKLSHLGDLAQRVSNVMKGPAGLLQA